MAWHLSGGESPSPRLVHSAAFSALRCLWPNLQRFVCASEKMLWCLFLTRGDGARGRRGRSSAPARACRRALGLLRLRQSSQSRVGTARIDPPRRGWLVLALGRQEQRLRRRQAAVDRSSRMHRRILGQRSISWRPNPPRRCREKRRSSKRPPSLRARHAKPACLSHRGRLQH